MTREEIAKYILGQINWKTMEELTPSAIIRATELFDKEVCELDEVVDIYETLLKWGWFVKAGLIDLPPWTQDCELPWDQLVAIAPWGKNP